jgi:hypothetical protein
MERPYPPHIADALLQVTETAKVATEQGELADPSALGVAIQNAESLGLDGTEIATAGVVGFINADTQSST